MNNTKKKILITGGAGFIGSNFVYLILKERPERKVICIDSLTYASNIHTLNDAFKSDNFVFYHADIRDQEMIFEIFEKERPDIVVNFAAETHVDRSIVNPRLFLETNIIGTQVIMDACLKYDVKRFHQVGTDEVYGDLPHDRPDLFFHEDTPLRASSPYSASKAAADLLVMAYNRTYGLSVTISRCSNNYGPYQFPEKLIPLIIHNAMNEVELPIYGDGSNIRDWIYVKDHCYGILSVLENGKNGEIYNLGGHNEKSNLYIVKKILSTLNKSESLIKFVKDRKGHDRRYAIDPAKAKSELQREPKTNFDDGIVLTINWYINNQNWLNECTKNEYNDHCKEIYGNKK